jgi:hypothetical protein
MKIQVRYNAPGEYQTAIAEEDDPGATHKLLTHGSVAELDAAIRAEIDRARAWNRVKLPISVEGPSGSQEDLPQDLRDALSMITAEIAKRSGSS